MGSWFYLLAVVTLLVCRTISDAGEWPTGYYGLPKPLSGCPGMSSVPWKLGWRYQDTEDKNPSNGRSVSLHIDGSVKASSVNRSFCMKHSIMGDHWRPPWPPGQYCVYKRTYSCPTGLTSGYVEWHDEGYDCQNSKKGSIPRGVYQWGSTKIYYCCKNSGNKAIPITLPTGSPFYLFAYRSAVCQQVRWAEVTSEWITYDTEDSLNQDAVQAPYPYGAKGTGEGHSIHYCYYQSCNHTLIEKSGSFQSPRYPDRYPDGQLCSWRIMGHQGEIVTLRFTNFSLNDTADMDVLTVYDGLNENSTLIGSFSGSSIPRDIASTAHALFVIFHSDEAFSSAGFKAVYHISGPDATTSTTPTTATEQSSSNRVSSTLNPKSEVLTEELLTPTPTGSTNNSFEAFKRACASQSASANTALIVVPLICMIVVIAVAGYMLYRWRKLPGNKENEGTVRYSAESVENPSYLQGDIIIETTVPASHDHGRETAENPYENSPAGEIYQEIHPMNETTENPLYQQGTDPSNKPPATGIHLYDSLA